MRMPREDIGAQFTCPLCASDAASPVHADYVACLTCGLVYAPHRLWQDPPPKAADGWPQRCSHLGPELPKTALATCSVEQLSEALRKGPVYVECANTREPRLSLRHFFAARHPVYYEPQTLALCAIMAGADDIAMNEIAGNVCALVIPGGQRCSYEQAFSRGFASLGDVAERMRGHFAPRPPEVLGPEVEGACVVCGGQRRSWRSVTMCVACSALSVPDAGDPTPELGALLTPHVPHDFLAPNPRAMGAADAEAATLARKLVLDEHGWAVVALRAGADMVRVKKHDGALEVGCVAMGPPRAKTYEEARELLKTPPRTAHHTLAIWNLGPERSTPFEEWMAGEDVGDVDMLRREARKSVEIAGAALSALNSIALTLESQQDDPDDWHRDPFLRGMRMGKSAATLQAQSLISTAYMAIMERTIV